MTRSSRQRTHRKFPVADRIDIPDAVAGLEISSVPTDSRESETFLIPFRCCTDQFDGHMFIIVQVFP